MERSITLNLAAIFADTKYHQMIGVHLEFLLILNFAKEAIHSFMPNRQHLGAVAANQVVVQVIRNDLVNCCARPYVGNRYLPRLRQTIQRTVYCRLVDRRQSLADEPLQLKHGML